MASNNFFKVKNGINISTYSSFSDWSTNGIGATGHSSGDFGFAASVPYYVGTTLDKHPFGSVMAYKSVTASYTATASDHYISCYGSANGQSFTISLPTCNSVPTGKTFIIKNNASHSVLLRVSDSSTTFEYTSDLSPYDYGTLAPGWSATYINNGSSWFLV